MSIVMGFDDVCRLLPQKYPFIMVDVVEELELGKRIVCRKNVTSNEWMFPGHFPEKAIFPGVLLIEGMAQTAILLLRADDSLVVSESATYMLASVKTRFLKPVVPGDQLRYVCEAIRLASMGGVVEGVALVDGEIVAKSELTFAVQDPSRSR
ncbi:MAG TPA: 3-hydroxyacyl-ACP dehydratase FabZ [Ktedonobacteraceae bacterium]|jgi:3-hydroxyacyl-[acyl-carrier-protein] dehydratase